MTLEEARQFFAGDVFATEATGIVIEEVAEHYARCSLRLDRRHKNAVDQVMGGVLFTLADFAFAVAANHGGTMTVTSVSQISFLSPVKGRALQAECRLVKDGRRSCFYEVRITDDRDTLVALVSSNGIHLEK